MAIATYLSGRTRFVGFGIRTPLPIGLDPTQYAGAILYAEDDRLYWSDGKAWNKLLEVPINQPFALTPTTAAEQLQLRSSTYISAQQLPHTSTFWEVRSSNDFTGTTPNLLFTARKNAVDNINNDPFYLTTYDITEDDRIFANLDYGDEFWWTVRYESNAVVSDSSVPFKQIYPKEIQDPQARTPSGSIVGTLVTDPFETAFPQLFRFEGIQLEIYEVAQGGFGRKVVDELVPPSDETILGQIDISQYQLLDGIEYFWRAKHTAIGIRGSVQGRQVESNWTRERTFFPIPSTLVMVFDTSLGNQGPIVVYIGQVPVGETMTVDWGDGTPNEVFDSNSPTGYYTHEYRDQNGDYVDGIFTVRLTGKMESMGSLQANSWRNARSKLISVPAIGQEIGLTNLGYAFGWCTNLTYVSPILPAPDPASGYSGITSMVGAFRDCFNFNSYINDWDISNCRSLWDAFRGCNIFNQPLDKWDVSSLTGEYSLQNTFYQCYTFNQNLNAWGPRLGSSLDCTGTFRDCREYNQPMDLWDLQGVSEVNSMFQGCYKFNSPIGDWDLSSVTDTSYMFDNARAFNQDISNWQVSNVVSMRGMFRNASAFSQDISTRTVDINGNPTVVWDVARCTDFAFMFDQITLSEPERGRPFVIDVSTWDIGGRVVTANIDMSGMFRGRHRFNSNILGWDMAKVDQTNEMFRDCRDFNQDISVWDMSNIQQAQYMLAECVNFNQPIGNWDFSSIGTDAAQVGSINYLLRGCRAFNQVINWDLSHAGIRRLEGVFQRCANFGGFVNNAPLITGVSYFFDDSDPKWAANVTDIDNLFNGCEVFNEDLSSWNTSNITSMQNVFYSCSLFTNGTNDAVAGGIDNWDVSNVTRINSIFAFAKQFNRPVGSWDVGNVEYMYQCFRHAENFNQPLTNWNPVKCINARSMFYYARVFNQDITHMFNIPDGSEVLEVANTFFYGALAFNNGEARSGDSGWSINHTPPDAGTRPLTWNMQKCSDMHYMFCNAQAFNQDISSWNVPLTKRITLMFHGALRFNNGEAGGQSTRPLDIGIGPEVNQIAKQTFYAANWFNQSVDSWELDNCPNMFRFFMYARRFNQSLANFFQHLGNVESTEQMFEYAWSFNQPLTGWSSPKNTNMDRMFYGARDFDQDMGIMVIPAVASMVDLLATGSTVYIPNLSTANYESTLKGWRNQPMQRGVNVNFGTAVPNADTIIYRNFLVQNLDWTIKDSTGTYSNTPST